MLEYQAVIETQGIRIPFVPEIITPRIERPMRNNRYEGGECSALRRALRPGDRVLELGAGVGLCSAVAAAMPGVAQVVTVEANPDLIPLIRETHRLNGITNVEVRNGVVASGAGDGPVRFYIRQDFWASSMEPDSRAWLRSEDLPAFPIGALLAETRPSVLVCDIEGGESGLFDRADLSSLRAVVIELHPKVYGDEGVARVLGVLAAKGLHPVETDTPEGTVRLLERRAGDTAPPPESRMPARSYRDWPISDPRVLVATCMKDEGPFILEWLAWHRALGVTDFIVFSNDCSDGTDRILDRLQDMGEVLHLPNPALVTGRTALQPTALAYAHHLRAFREADFFLSIDVDEFVNVRVGEGRLSDLFAATGPFDALSITEINHGCNGREHFTPGWVTEQFPRHQSESPGRRKARRGVKTIVRLSPLVARARNHRPDFLDGARPPLWLDGSGRLQTSLPGEPAENGIDCRGSYGLVSLEHYALRSLDSYLMKMLRGDVVVPDKRVSRFYWRARNHNEVQTSDLSRLAPAARREHAERFACDAALMALHQAACAAHAERVATLRDDGIYRERREWILANAW